MGRALSLTPERTLGGFRVWFPRSPASSNGLETVVAFRSHRLRLGVLMFCVGESPRFWGNALGVAASRLSGHRLEELNSPLTSTPCRALFQLQSPAGTLNGGSCQQPVRAASGTRARWLPGAGTLGPCAPFLGGLRRSVIVDEWLPRYIQVALACVRILLPAEAAYPGSGGHGPRPKRLERNSLGNHFRRWSPLRGSSQLRV